MKDIGYDSYNPVLNMGTLFILICFYILKIVLFAIIVYPMWHFKKMKRPKYAKIKRYLFWAHGVAIFVEGYIEYLISARLFYNAPPSSVDKTTGMYIIAYTVLGVSALALPASYLWIMTKSVA